MSRRYADPVRVQVAPSPVNDDPAAPQSFRWRHHDYRVVAVLARWVEADAWWRTAVPAAADPGGVTAPTLVDRVVWRVEAGSDGRTGVFDLCHDVLAWPPTATRGTGRGWWHLARALD